LATEEHWPTPQTWRISTLEELENALPRIPFPCILKPAVKNAAFRLHSPVKARKLQDRSELLAAYRDFAEWEPEAVVQEWIEGGDDRVAFCLGYWNEHSQPRALFPGRKLRQWPVECGNTAMAEPAPEEWRQPITSLTARIFERVGFVGLGSVEFKIRLRDASPVIMEPTVGRTNYQNEVAVINGINIPAIAYFDALGDPTLIPPALAAPKLAHKPVKLIDGMADYRAAKIYMSQGRLTRDQWLHSRRGPKRYMLFRPNDPMPFVVSVCRTAAVRFRRSVYGVLRPVARTLGLR
jgi:D-aspartate ligase